MKRSREPEEPPSSPSSFGSADADSTAPTMNVGSEPAPKIRELGDESGEDRGSEQANAFRCSLHVETTTFGTCEEYDSHYNKEHMNRCHECRRNFPSNHLLNLHLEECHDSFVAVKREKGEHTYSCFVEGCDRKCRDPAKRRRHLIDKHKYPENFFFDVTRRGIDGRQSLLTHYRPRRTTRSKAHKAENAASGPDLHTVAAVSPSATKSRRAEEGGTPPATVDEDDDGSVNDAEMDMDGLAQNMSSLKLVPRSIQFGRGGKGKGGFARSPKDGAAQSRGLRS